MTTETKLRAGFAFSILASLWLTVMWNNSNALNYKKTKLIV